MDTLTRSASIRNRVRVWRDAGRQVAWVPTTAPLHQGHMLLVAEAQERANRVIVSVEHLADADRELLANVGADLVFVPPVQELFPVGREQAAVVGVPALSTILEGAALPGHYLAATTVLFKLFNIVRPDWVVVGEHDFQQLVILRRLIDDLFLSIDVVACPVLRDGDGLAIASVNRELTAEQRVRAPVLQATLREVAAQIDAGERDYERLEVRARLALEASGFVTDYLTVRQAADLAPVAAGARELVILAAARLGSTRLTDNLRVRLIDRF